MRRPSAGEVAAWAAGTPLAALAGLVVAPALEGGLSLPALAASLADPLSAGLVPGSARCAALFAAVYAACAGAYLLTRRNLRPGEEHGSAEWGDPRAIARRYRGRDPSGDKLLTRSFRMSYDTHAHRRSMNTLLPPMYFPPFTPMIHNRSRQPAPAGYANVFPPLSAPPPNLSRNARASRARALSEPG